MQLDERLISLRQLKMMSPWKQIVLLSITGCLAGKILEPGLYWCLSEYIVTVDVTTSSLLSLPCIFINNQTKYAATHTYPSLNVVFPPACPSRLPICNAAKGNWDPLLVYGPSRSLSESMQRIQPCSLAAATCPPVSFCPSWPPGIGASGVQMLHPNVNPCLNDIVNLDECYSNWLTGGSPPPALEGERPKQTHLPRGRRL